MTNPYLLLGVSPEATQAEITHDMRPPASNSGTDERLRQILAAYALLRDPHRRAAYDRITEPPRTPIGPTQIAVTHDNAEGQPPPATALLCGWERSSKTPRACGLPKPGGG